MSELLFNDTTQRVDSLHGVVEQLNHQVSELLSLNRDRPSVPSFTPTHAEPQPAPETERLFPEPGAGVALLQHKDILMDGDRGDRHWDRSSDERSLSPEIQVRRLTAQVTAAYNRIAALEEQLLSLRSPH
ncbi:MAG: hypothetical protein HC838_11575 [Spirulinaceae cyanobacterium RM2_2_10]|nr:hypothetical protein [Spirulinaceae cyanobacterium SM2_1_0]NJO20544.1 hypothetical protein [Spirulinaceae cyanobacterium RM2_2_10]